MSHIKKGHSIPERTLVCSSCEQQFLYGDTKRYVTSVAQATTDEAPIHKAWRTLREFRPAPLAEGEDGEEGASLKKGAD